MADSRVNLKITADASQARRAGRDIDAAFNPRGLKAVKAAGKDLEAQLVAVSRRTVDLSRVMQGIEKGCAAYKHLQKELKSAAEDAKLLATALRAVDTVTNESDRRRREREQRRRSFGGGLMQGLGLADYMPAEPGMGRRIAGAMLGRGVRRAAGMASAPFLNPGMGGLSAAAGMIPLVGPGIAGALSTAAGAYQQAVGYDRARLANIPYAGAGVMERMRVGRPGRAGRNPYDFEMSEADLAKRRSPSENALESRAAALAAAVTANQTISDVTLGTGGQGGVVAEKALLGRAAKFATRMARREGIGTIRKVAGVEAADAAASAQATAAEKAQAASWTTVKRHLPGMETGVPFGIGPQQMMGHFGEFMGARGGVYDEQTRGGFIEALAAKTRFGIAPDTAGRFARAGVAGGGGRGIEAAQGLSGTLQAAFRAGLEGSQIAEYLQTLVSLTEQAERTGVKIDVREFNRMAGGLTGIGIEGLQAQRIAGGLTQAGMGLSERGVSKPADMLMLRAAGFRPEQGAEGYAAAMRKLEGGLDVDMMQNLLRSSAEGVKAGGFGPEMQSLLLKRLMGSGFGVKIGMEQADKLIAAGGMGAEGLSAEMARQFGAGERPGARAGLIRGAKSAAASQAGLAVGAAGLEASQIGAGYSAASFVPTFERAQLAAANLISRNFGAHLGKLGLLVTAGITRIDMLIAALKIGGVRLVGPGGP